MSKFSIVYTKQSDVIKFVRLFGEAMAVEHNCSLIAHDANVEADTLKGGVLNHASKETLKIYFREHGTFNNFSSYGGNPKSLIEFWEQQLIGVLNIDVSYKMPHGKGQHYSIYYEKYERKN